MSRAPRRIRTRAIAAYSGQRERPPAAAATGSGPPEVVVTRVAEAGGGVAAMTRVWSRAGAGAGAVRGSRSAVASSAPSA